MNRRYEALRKRLRLSLDDLEIADRCVDETMNVQDNLDWITATQVKLERSRPRALEIQPLEDELEIFKVQSIDSLDNNGPWLQRVALFGCLSSISTVSAKTC